MSKIDVCIFLAGACVALLSSCGGPERYVKRGDAARAIGEYAEAAAQYKKAYSKYGPRERRERGAVAYSMAECYRRYGNTARALGAYRNALRYGVTDTLARFYEGEIRMRRLRRCPPFADIFTFTVSGADEGAVLRAAGRVRQSLNGLCTAPDLAAAEPEALGPAPAAVVKLNNRYRYRCLLVCRNDSAARAHIRALLRDFAADRANRGIHLFADCNSME